MRFWDSSALVALLVEESDSRRRAEQLAEDVALAVWWGTTIECESAIQRRLREQALDVRGARYARQRLSELAAAWHEVPPTAEVRTLAVRLLRTHPLRAGDALQLAAALALTGALSQRLAFVCADTRLNEAAELENLSVLP